MNRTLTLTPKPDLPAGSPLASIRDAATLRSPILPVIPFADAAWFRRFMNVSNRDIRLFHEHDGPLVKQRTGFDWPEKRPSMDEFYELVAQGIRYPFFMTALQLALFKRDRHCHKAVLRLFRDEMVRKGFSTLPTEDGDDPREVVDVLRAGGDPDVCAAVVIIVWSASCLWVSMDGYLEAAEGLNLFSADLTAYCRAQFACSPRAWAEGPWGKNGEPHDFMSAMPEPMVDLQDDENTGDLTHMAEDEDSSDPSPQPAPASAADEGPAAPNAAFCSIKDPDTLRSPILPELSFVDGPWIARFLSFSKRDVRIVHDKLGPHLSAQCGFPWPSERPTHEEFFELVGKGLRYPFFIATLLAFLRTQNRFPDDLLKHKSQDTIIKVGKNPTFSTYGYDDAPLEIVDVFDLGGDTDVLAANCVIYWPSSIDWHKRSAFPEVPERMAKLFDGEVRAYLDALFACDPAAWIKAMKGDIKQNLVEKAATEDKAKAADKRRRKKTAAAADADAAGSAEELPPPEPPADQPKTEAAPTPEQDDISLEPLTVKPTAIKTNPEPAATSELDRLQADWNQAKTELATLAAAHQLPNAVTAADTAKIAAKLALIAEAYAAATPKGVTTDEVLQKIDAQADRLNKVFDQLGETPDAASLDGARSNAPAIATADSVVAATEAADRAAISAGSAEVGFGTWQEAQKTLPPKAFMTQGPALLAEAEEAAAAGFKSVLEALTALEPYEAAAPRPKLSVVASAPVEDVPSKSDEPAAVKDEPAAELPVADEEQAEPEQTTTAEETPAASEPAEFVVEPSHEDAAPADADEEPEFSAELPEPTELTLEEPVAADPIMLDVERKADELFATGEFGLGYHLARATERMLAKNPTKAHIKPPFSSGEMRLIALGEAIATGSRVDAQSYRTALDESSTVVQDLPDDTEDRTNARRIALMAAAIPTALFSVADSGSAFSIIERVKPAGSCKHFWFLIETLEENRRQGYPLNATNIHALRAAKVDETVSDERLAAIDEHITSIRNSTYRFVLGTQMKHWLTSKDGPVGILAEALQGPSALVAAGEFADNYGDREKVADMLLRAASHTLGAMQVIDGMARERMIGQISDLASLCSNYVDASGHAADLKKNGPRTEVVRRLVDQLTTGIERFNADTSEPCDQPLSAAAKAYARMVLAGVSRALKGATPPQGRLAQNVALHLPLMWLPDVTWGGAWTPTPYDPTQLIEAIVKLPVPRITGSLSDALETAVRARRAEDAFLPARILLAHADRFDMDKARAADLLEQIDGAEATRKGQLQSRRTDVSRMVDKVRRMALGSLEEAARLQELLTSTQIDDITSEASIDYLPEELEGARVQDINAAMDRLSDVEARSRALLDEAKLGFSDRIEALTASGKLEPQDRDRLNRLLKNDDLATLSDWIGWFESDSDQRPVLTGDVMNPGLKRFLELSPALGGNLDLPTAVQAVVSGGTYGPLSFDGIDEQRRAEIVTALREWGAFKRMMRPGGAPATDMARSLASLMSRIAYRANLIGANNKLTDERRQIYAIDVKMELPHEPNSLLLPDFGSLTDGGWRVIAAPASLSQSEIVAKAEGAETRGTIVLLFGPLTAEKRNLIRIESLRQKKKLLVIDETLLLIAMATPENRPLTMIEIAQGFTTASPFMDFGRSNVPKEIFKGRARERSAIVNPYGSYLVYGGRRLGKTALLRSIAQNAPEHAIFAFLDLAEDTSPGAFWDHASKALGAPHGQRAATAEDFETLVKSYLAGDSRRRILLMLDEADNFVRQQASAEVLHHHVTRLLSLMADTNHRFKFILAGLQNVSRVTRAENSPLAQISNNPIRIGPLVKGDLGEAEALIRGPLAALGYEFENREAVWSVLSLCNYMPILVVLFAAGLLRIAEETTVRTGKPVHLIDSRMIAEAMQSKQIRQTLYDSFDKTISTIERRYELLTYIIAERALLEANDGAENEGLSAYQVAERAAMYWPEAFPKGNDPAEVGYLLDELEGFGILRGGSNGRWTLRSRMLLDLMVANEEDLLQRIYAFKGTQPEIQFDPKNGRRKFAAHDNPSGEPRTSPLTDGQEAHILSPLPDAPKTTVIFGAPVGSISDVWSALKTSRTALGANDRRVEVIVRGYRDRNELLQAIRRPGVANVTRIVVVTDKTPWTAEWVIEATKSAPVLRGEVRPVFIGAETHALNWVNNVKKMKIGRISVETTRPWARSYLANKLDACNALGSNGVDKLIEATGGWNTLCHSVFASAATTAQVEKATHEAVESFLKDKPSTKLGIPDALLPAFQALAEYGQEDGLTSDFADDVLKESSPTTDTDSVLRFGALMGVLQLTPDPSVPGRNFIKMNSLAYRALRA